MNIFGQDFIYDGTALSSLDDDFLMVSLDSDTSDMMYGRTITGGSITNDNYIRHYYGHITEEVIEFDVAITRCSNQPLTKADVKLLTDWLFAYSEPKTFEVIPNDGEFGIFEDVEFIGAFTSMNYESDHQIISFHFESISGYAFTKVQTFNVNTASSSSLTIENTGSKTGEIIYPVVTVTPSATGTLQITMSGTTTFSVNMTNGTTFVIDDRNMYLPNGTLYSLDNLNNFNWPYIKDGTNVWTFTGNAQLQIQTRFLVTTGF